MNTRTLIASSITALMIFSGNAIAHEERPPFPSSAFEVGGHWTGKVGRDSVPGTGRGVFPSGGRSTVRAQLPAAPTRSTPDRMSGQGGSSFPSAGIEISGRTI